MYIVDGIAYAGEPRKPVKVSCVRPISNHRLWLRFDTGEVRVFACLTMSILISVCPSGKTAKSTSIPNGYMPTAYR